MTEQEKKAVEQLERLSSMLGAIGETEDYTEIAVNALEEIQQYRAIGTVNEFKSLKEDWLNKFDRLIEYRKIGTLEKCRAAVEKQKEKKPKKSGVTDNNGVFHPINGINGEPYDLCPACGANLCTDGFFGADKKYLKYCKSCGKKLDWGEEDE